MTYELEDYFKDIDTKGLKKTWNSILINILNNKLVSNIFILDNFGELYEIGLEYENKINKKELGKYYTPKDVCLVMSKWLEKLPGENVCDIGCGTGNLILSYLEILGKKKAYDLINNNNLYLYDLDEVALLICKYSIAIKYGKDLFNKINVKKGDFLNKKIKLPKNSKVISNPPYYKITEFKNEWDKTKVITDSKELYSAFLEKIIKQSVAAVIITPYSFIGSSKFYSLRQVMNDYNGFVISFDNVPGNIFNGKKHGIFNSNACNSVRAAITVVENKENVKGFKFSPLIRFKTVERKRLLNNNYLESLITNRYQIVNSKKKSYYKCHQELLNILDKWEENSNQKMGSIINNHEGEVMYVPTTCRYFTVASKKKLNRDGKREIYILEKEKYNYVYCMLNSTFAYWYWRLYDGGINCPLTIINSIPIFYDKLTANQKKELNKIASEMQENETKYLVYKMNAGKKQENIKFPVKYRNKINKIFLDVLEIDEDIKIFNKIHSSSLFIESEEKDEI